VADRYQVVISARAVRDLRRLDRLEQQAVLAALEALGGQPRSGKQLVRDLAGLWSLGRGDYRVLYRIDDRAVKIEVARIAHRREVYRQR
jgi:mRNA interferase RelE/StbE